uniref:uncharacterized protein n=1 Tax=Myxine glutinosa TaxID=7769 RepID=UPI00358E8097
MEALPYGLKSLLHVLSFLDVPKSMKNVPCYEDKCGECPEPTHCTWNEHSRHCHRDCDCPGKQKCCVTKNNKRICVEPKAGTCHERPGECPDPAHCIWDHWNCKTCRCDDDCPCQQKCCCTKDGKRMCVEPKVPCYEDKCGECPEPTHCTWNEHSRHCHRDCDCPGKQKCCVTKNNKRICDPAMKSPESVLILHIVSGTIGTAKHAGVTMNAQETRNAAAPKMDIIITILLLIILIILLTILFHVMRTSAGNALNQHTAHGMNTAGTAIVIVTAQESRNAASPRTRRESVWNPKLDPAMKSPESVLILHIVSGIIGTAKHAGVMMNAQVTRNAAAPKMARGCAWNQKDIIITILLLIILIILLTILFHVMRTSAGNALNQHTARGMNTAGTAIVIVTAQESRNAASPRTTRESVWNPKLDPAMKSPESVLILHIVSGIIGTAKHAGVMMNAQVTRNAAAPKMARGCAWNQKDIIITILLLIILIILLTILFHVMRTSAGNALNQHTARGMNTAGTAIVIVTAQESRNAASPRTTRESVWNPKLDPAMKSPESVLILHIVSGIIGTAKHAGVMMNAQVTRNAAAPKMARGCAWNQKDIIITILLLIILIILLTILFHVMRTSAGNALNQHTARGMNTAGTAIVIVTAQESRNAASARTTRESVWNPKLDPAMKSPESVLILHIVSGIIGTAKHAGVMMNAQVTRNAAAPKMARGCAWNQKDIIITILLLIILIILLTILFHVMRTSAGNALNQHTARGMNTAGTAIVIVTAQESRNAASPRTTRESVWNPKLDPAMKSPESVLILHIVSGIIGTAKHAGVMMNAQVTRNAAAPKMARGCAWN